MLPELLFEQGDPFLMPSSFEPRGISRILVARESDHATRTDTVDAAQARHFPRRASARRYIDGLYT